MKYIELTVETTHFCSELVSDIIENFTSEGVFIQDSMDVIELEKAGKTWDYLEDGVFNESSIVTVKGFIETGKEDIIESIKLALSELKKVCPFDTGSLNLSTKEIDGDKWREEWKNNFKPIKIGEIVIVPGWIDYEKKQDEIIVVMDSNMAFGTGEHETTSMCVEFLQKYVKSDDVVLDVGCGSGILGITASKLGAKEVIMTDIDECAIVATNHNLERNGVKNGKALFKNLLDDNSVKGDVIVCNIMAEVLIGFAPYIGQNLKENGRIILSGILNEKSQSVECAYEENGFSLIEKKSKGEWTALVLKKS